MSNIRTRIAPSPTGNLHIGTARTALFNYLFAKKTGGKFIIRIEDTDLERSKKEYEKNILEGLAWLGLNADESPDKAGEFGPYRQSERLKSYAPYIQKLLGEGKVFYCFHTEVELKKEKEELMKSKRSPLHICEYRGMGKEEAEVLKEAKGDFIIRFKNHLGREISFCDLIRGKLTFKSDLLGDFSIAKRIDSPLYNFAVIVDDHEMKISHIIRGEDHIYNTPKQILLQEALEIPRPKYAHLPLILGPDKSKMSKRHGAASLEEYRQQGYLSEVLFNFMALLGWNPGGDEEIFSREELINLFSLEKVHKAGAVFDAKKLDWMNGEYIRRQTTKHLVELTKPFLSSKVKTTDEYLKKVLELEKPRLKKLADIAKSAEYFFTLPDYAPDLLFWKKMTREETADSLRKSLNIIRRHQKSAPEELNKIFMETAAKEGDKGRLLWPLRAALSGRKASAGPLEIISVLGVKESVARLEKAILKIE